MSQQLRDALGATDATTIELTRSLLLAAADAATAKEDRSALLYAALVDDLDVPAQTYRTALHAAAVMADEEVDAVLQDLLLTAGDHPDNPLPMALARELGAVSALARFERDRMAAGLAATDTPQDLL